MYTYSFFLLLTFPTLFPLSLLLFLSFFSAFLPYCIITRAGLLAAFKLCNTPHASLTPRVVAFTPPASPLIDPANLSTCITSFAWSSHVSFFFFLIPVSLSAAFHAPP